MKADFSDAPERVTRRRRSRSIRSLVACLAVVGMVAAAVFLLIGRPEPRRLIPPLGITSQALDGDTNKGSVLRSEPASLDTVVDSASRQTSFNDQNFEPTGAHNIVIYHPNYDGTHRIEPTQKVRLTIVRQTPSMKDRVCWPFRQGSIESRNCRLSVGLKHRG